jgi:hypothetical protein
VTKAVANFVAVPLTKRLLSIAMADSSGAGVGGAGAGRAGAGGAITFVLGVSADELQIQVEGTGWSHL